MSRAAFRFDALPTDVFALFLRFFSGFELLPLSHVNRRFYRDLLSPQSAAWSSRLPSRSFLAPATPDPRPRSASARRWKAKYKKVVNAAKDLARARSLETITCDKTRLNWKRLYFSSTSIQFPGCPPRPAVEREDGGAVPLWGGLHHAWNADAFSFDLWFALCPSSETKMFGGIVFAAQGTEWPGLKFGDDCQQFLHVDTSGNLYCSMTVEKTIVASELKANRWYHVAVSVEHPPNDWWTPTQSVYLDGQQIYQGVGSVFPRWRYLNHAQLGSGVIDSRSPGAPHPQHRGWYGLNGAIDDFRFWDGVVTPEQVTQLFRGRESVVEADGVACVWSLKRDGGLATYGPNVQRVRSTRPREQQYVLA